MSSSSASGIGTPQSKKALFPAWVRWIFSIGIIGFIFTQVDLKLLGESFRGVNLYLVGLAFFLATLEQVVTSFLWRGMLSYKGYKIPFIPYLRIWFASNFMGFALPSSLGPDLLRVIGLGRYIKNSSEALSSLALIRMFGIGIIFVIALTSALLFSERLPESMEMNVVTIGLAIGLLGYCTALLMAGPFFDFFVKRMEKTSFIWLSSRLSKFHEAFSLYLASPGAILLALLAATYSQLTNIATIAIIAMGMSLDVDITALCVFVPIVVVITRLPISIAGIGLREGGFVLLLGYVGISATEALALSAISFGVSLVVVLLSGVVYWVYGFPQEQ